jgi:hypothetical protein
MDLELYQRTKSHLILETVMEGYFTVVIKNLINAYSDFNISVGLLLNHLDITKEEIYITMSSLIPKYY